MLKQKLLAACLLIGLAACQNSNQNQVADTIIINGNIWTVDTLQPTAEALAIKEGRIISVGSTQDIQQLKGEKTSIIDANGDFVMPGFIEGHAHLSSLGNSLQNLNFLKLDFYKRCNA